jgi:hypothetical protein
MPDCYLITVSRGSSLDRYSNNWSLFTLVEQVEVKRIPIDLPFEIHTYWKFEPHECNEDFEMRVLFVHPTGERTPGDPFSLRSPTPRFRFRVTGFPVTVAGDCTFRVEWRRPGQETWKLCHVYWPFSVTVQAELEQNSSDN